MKRKLLLPVATLVMAGFMLMPSIGVAQSTTTTAQLTQLSALLEQIQALQTQINALLASQNALKSEAAQQISAFVASLDLGSQGEDVLALQALLAANPEIYPEGLITGYFGPLTHQAVKRLQKENGLEQVGRVGPKTRALLNALLKDHPVALEDDEDEDDNDDDNGKRPCAIVPPGHLIAPGWLKKHDGERPIVPECQTLPGGIAKKLSDDDWKKATTTPDTTAPVISNLTATNIASTTASVSWNTNESATSTIWYSDATPVDMATASTSSNNNLKKSHIYDLTSLVASTTYYYLVKVSDSVGNSATSSQSSFETVGN